MTANTISLRFTGFYRKTNQSDEVAGLIDDARFEVVANGEKRPCRRVPEGEPLTKWELMMDHMIRQGWKYSTRKVYNGQHTPKGRYFERVQKFVRK